MNEPNYFTEKFVEAVIAGCVPVYRAHATVRDSILQGASWIDPADHDNCPKKTLAAAFEAPAGKVRAQNAEWFRSVAVEQTHHVTIFARLAEILREN